MSEMKFIASIIAGLACLADISPPLARGKQIRQEVRRPVTEADVIGMTLVPLDGLEGQVWRNEPTAKFSPDVKQFVIVLRKGQIETNTNVYSLLLYRTANALQ